MATFDTRSGVRLVVGACVLVLGLSVLVPAVADIGDVGSADEFPRVAFVARNDVPFDSLAVGPVAGALGGVVALTPAAGLSDAARDTLVEFDPDVVVLAGGEAALSASVEDEVGAAGDWEVERVAGAGRDQTAAQIAGILDDLGVDRPVLAGDREIVGDVTIGGSLTVDSISVTDGIDADTLDGAGPEDFVAADAGDLHRVSVSPTELEYEDASFSNGNAEVWGVRLADTERGMFSYALTLPERYPAGALIEVDVLGWVSADTDCTVMLEPNSVSFVREGSAPTTDGPAATDGMEPADGSDTLEIPAEDDVAVTKTFHLEWAEGPQPGDTLGFSVFRRGDGSQDTCASDYHVGGLEISWPAE